jgi:hypothetical protein
MVTLPSPLLLATACNHFIQIGGNTICIKPRLR